MVGSPVHTRCLKPQQFTDWAYTRQAEVTSYLSFSYFLHPDHQSVPIGIPLLSDHHKKHLSLSGVNT